MFLNDVAVGDGRDGLRVGHDGEQDLRGEGRQGVGVCRGEELEYPNGLLVDGDRLIVGGWGSPRLTSAPRYPGICSRST